ncbi:MAG: glycosyl hydrolase family 28-related protein, partial [Verrucomicrobiota bacterium]
MRVDFCSNCSFSWQRWVLRCSVLVLCANAVLLQAANLTTTNVQTSGTDDWTASIWRTNGTGNFVGSPISGNTYEMINNGLPYGTNGSTRVRGPIGGTGVNLSFTFTGDSLTVGTNTEFRFGTGTTVPNQSGTNIFPGVSGNPGLILKGGVLDTRQGNLFAYVGGVIRVDAQSYLSHAINGGGSPNANSAWHLYGQLTGTNNLVIFGGNLTGLSEISCSSNTFSGQWFIKAGYLLGSVAGALGTNSITVDPQYVLPFTTAVNTAGPALLEVNYDLNSAGVLVLTNGGQMQLHQNCYFSGAIIEGTPLSSGLHTYAELSSAYPGNFPAGGSGSITVRPYNVITPLTGIPAAALNDPRYALGYLVVTYYPGVTNNGTGDCRLGIQNALDHAFAANYDFQSTGTNRALAVFFPPGTYQISDILECYQWQPTNQQQLVNGFHTVVGSTEGSNRPVIKLASGAANYQNSTAPRQMISFRKFEGGYSTYANVPSPSVPVPDPMSTPGGYVDYPGNLFWDELRNIDFDCNSNPGAVGVMMSGCQNCAIVNVKVDAAGAFAGFCVLPGAGACCANIEVEGGQYGV